MKFFILNFIRLLTVLLAFTKLQSLRCNVGNIWKKLVLDELFKKSLLSPPAVCLQTYVWCDSAIISFLRGPYRRLNKMPPNVFASSKCFIHPPASPARRYTQGRKCEGPHSVQDYRWSHWQAVVCEPPHLYVCLFYVGTTTGRFCMSPKTNE